jgi:chemotaxis family two-component system response regulator Rcp1
MNQKGHTRSSPFEVLLVEDSAGDVRLTREALKDTKMRISLNVLSDGAEAMAYLRREKTHAEASRPDLILLDLNLPKKDGRDVLKEIKESDALKSIPVVILTTSASPMDVERSYQLHANCYITKPMDLRGFTKVLQSIEQFWLSVVKLPSTLGSRG